jgi:hypothetical protein
MVDLFEKWWAACAIIAEHSDPPKTREDISDGLLIMVGEVKYYETQVINDKIINKVKPKSISWPRMDANKFEEVYQKAEPIMCEMLKCTKEELLNNVIFEREKEEKLNAEYEVSL